MTDILKQLLGTSDADCLDKADCPKGHIKGVQARIRRQSRSTETVLGKGNFAMQWVVLRIEWRRKTNLLSNTSRLPHMLAAFRLDKFSGDGNP